MDTLRLIFWPTLITALVSAARLVAEVQGWASPRSGGALNPLGISWLAFVFGGYFALRISRLGSQPRQQPAWPWCVGAFILIVISIGWQFGPLLEANQSDETFQRVRSAVLVLTVIATTLAIVDFVIWRRLFVTMLCYAVPTRGIVVGMTWLAKHNEWNTHYTKFGPPGIELDMANTMVSATIAQGGFWIPWTIIAGFVAGSFFGRRLQPGQQTGQAA